MLWKTCQPLFACIMSCDVSLPQSPISAIHHFGMWHDKLWMGFCNIRLLDPIAKAWSEVDHFYFLFGHVRIEMEGVACIFLQCSELKVFFFWSLSNWTTSMAWPNLHVTCTDQISRYFNKWRIASSNISSCPATVLLKSPGKLWDVSNSAESVVFFYFWYKGVVYVLKKMIRRNFFPLCDVRYFSN